MILFLFIVLSILLVIGIAFGIVIGGKIIDDKNNERENNDF